VDLSACSSSSISRDSWTSEQEVQRAATQRMEGKSQLVVLAKRLKRNSD
jgi:hypothetical protein